MICYIFTIFTISANIAWLNPRPGFHPAFKLSEKIPLFWQYNRDSRASLLASTGFPESMENSIRRNRPLYHILAHYLGKCFYPFVTVLAKSDSVTHTDLVYGTTALGYLVLKFFIYSLAAILAFKILQRYLEDEVAFLGILLIFTSQYLIEMITTYHASDTQVTSAIFIIFMFLSLSDHYTTKKNIIYSIVVGILFLAKQTFVIYSAILVFSLLKRKYKEVLLSFVAILIPLAAWLLFLNLSGFRYENGEMSVGVVNSLFDFKSNLIVLELSQKLLRHFTSFWEYLAAFYSFLFPASIVGLTLYFQKHHKYNLVMFICIVLCFQFIQSVAINYNTGKYIVADLEIIICGAVAYLLKVASDTFDFNFMKVSIFLVVGLFIINIMHLVNFPWIHPYLQ